jgi:hypothetical protein
VRQKIKIVRTQSTQRGENRAFACDLQTPCAPRCACRCLPLKKQQIGWRGGSGGKMVTGRRRP